MLVEIAIADAYGAGFEYAPPTPGRRNEARAYVQHPRHRNTRPGEFTDDTQMSVAVAECLLAGRVDAAGFAEAFVAAYKRDPRPGYSRGFRDFLETTADGAEFIARIRPHSEKSGAAMRAGPIGLLPTIGQVMTIAADQARLTHNTQGGIAAAQAAALMVHHQVYRLGARSDLALFIEEHVPGHAWAIPPKNEPPQLGAVIVRSAITALKHASSLSGVLQRAVAQGGDTDTTAVIAMAAASVSSDLPRDLHSDLVAGLERGPFGHDFLAALDRHLARAFALPVIAAGPSHSHQT